MMENWKEFYKKYRSFLIWAFGIALVIFIHKTSYTPDFVTDYEIVTWDNLAIIFILTICSFMTTEDLFWWEKQNKWAKKVQEDIALNETKLETLTEILKGCESHEDEKTQILTKGISKSLSTLCEAKFKNEQAIKELTKKYENLRNLIFNHLHDCPDVFQCRKCDHVFDETHLSFIDDDWMCPNCNSTYMVSEMKIHRHLQPSEREQ